MRKLRFPAIFFVIFALIGSVLLFTPKSALAANCFPQGAGSAVDLGSCLTLQDGKSVSTVYKTPADLVNLVVRNIFIVAGLILFMLIIYSGFIFISGGEKEVTKAKDILTTALIGLLIMFAAYWIVQIIKIVTGADILF